MFATRTFSVQSSPSGTLFSMVTASISFLSRTTPVFAVHRSTPFHAIITPLSLHNCGGVRTNWKLFSEQTISKAFAKKLLHATPPDITCMRGNRYVKSLGWKLTKVDFYVPRFASLAVSNSFDRYIPSPSAS